ncbi:ABC transporter substrate-binding protein [Alkalilacustris brevis]|uniref:ABC transporter substrate-binding protein n=1 Tax=Alkalilacustris brevis TaxID=2026338 RepID=UPI000E0DE74D|nr:ABC transporter substrate-binding protein [Alkalilacustris brevis]
MSDTPQPLRVIAFPGAPNLPTFAAIEKGYFAQAGLDVTVELTASSIEQAKRTAAGEFDVVCTAFDNVVAYAEGQGAAGPDVDPEYVVIAGATQLELSLVVASEITSFEDLRGKTLALDAVATGFAFVLYEMLARHGLSRDDVEMVEVGATPQRWQSLKAGEHVGTLTIEPFTSIAQRAGFNVLARSSDIFDSYQGGIIATRRSVLAQSPKPLQAFLRGYLRGLEWVQNPANRDEAETILQARMPQILPQAVTPVMKSLLSPRSGLTPGAAILPEGMRTVLKLRSTYGGGARLENPKRYLDLSLLESAPE